MNSVLEAQEHSHLLARDDGSSWGQVNRAPFMFQHRLAHHPMFEMSRLARMAELAIDQGNGDPYATGQEKLLTKAERKRRMLDNISHLDTGEHWLKVSAINRLHPDYDELLHSLLGEIEGLSGLQVRKLMTWSGLDVFMNSPHLQVPYHFDHDTNFLMQIRGEKDVFLFDPEDRTVLTEPEIEDFYRGNKLAGRYRDALDGVGKCHHLSPGVGVHQPPLAPHLIRNGAAISVSVACYFVLPGQERIARVYQSNHFMRKLGMHPKPPGQSALSDWAKNNLMRAVSKAHPASYDERLYSGVQRLGSPSRMARRVADILRAH